MGPASAVNGARVYAIDAVGKYCGRSDVDGKPNPDKTPSVAYADASGLFELRAKCLFPVVLFADLPDANDTLPLPEDAIGEGTRYYTFISEITKDGHAFAANLTPVSTAMTLLVSAKQPGLGIQNPKSVLNEARRDQARQLIETAMDIFAPATAYSGSEFLDGDVSPGSPLAKLLQFIQISFERVDSTKQTIVRFHAPSEHRPLVLIATDANPLSEATFDPGLGVAIDSVDRDALAQAYSSYQDINGFLTSGDPLNPANYDSCFLHNGSRLIASLFDVPVGWDPPFASAAEQVSLIRLNVYTDLTNDTLEVRNDVPGSTLAFASFDFRNKHGLRQRAYTWLIKGDRDVNGCSSSGAGWRILGNQRTVYVKTDSIAVHEVLHNQQFASRKDSYGSGTEHFVYLPAGEDYTHLLINGPGLPDNGVVFVRTGRTFLYSTGTLLKIRQLANSGRDESEYYKDIQRMVQDTRAVMMTDLMIRRLSDDYFDYRQNSFVYRLFKRWGDLYPTMTWTDTLPKRPYFAAERPVDYFHTVSVNIDNLVQSLQRSDPVVINWSLPVDMRKKPMLPEAVWFSRLNCMTPKSWPNCTDRATQWNEYDLALVPLWDPLASTATLVPDPLPFEEFRTFLGYARVRLLDSLNRPIETRVGMDYRR